MSRYFLALDGGGSKVDMVLFDEKLTKIACSKSEGANSKTYSAADVSANLKRGFEKLFGKFCPDNIEAAYGSVLADERLLHGILREAAAGFCDIERVFPAKEGYLGALAAGVSTDSVVVLAGTGADVFYMKDKKIELLFGGLGAFLGDEGSGFYLGRLAVRAYEDFFQGGVYNTVLFDELDRHYGVSGFKPVIGKIYEAKHTVREIAGLSRVVSSCALAGDALSLKLIHENAAILGGYAVRLLEKIGYKQMPVKPPICFCGGLFKAHPDIFSVIEAKISGYDAAAVFCRPIFEPVVGAVIDCALNLGYTLDDKFFRKMKIQYSNLLYK